jgi:hypothetical protein
MSEDLIVLGNIESWSYRSDGSIDVEVQLSIKRIATPLLAKINGWLRTTLTMRSAHAQLPSTREDIPGFLESNAVGALTMKGNTISINVPQSSRAFALVRRGVFKVLAAVVDDAGVMLVSMCDRVLDGLAKSASESVAVFKRAPIDADLAAIEARRESYARENAAQEAWLTRRSMRIATPAPAAPTKPERREAKRVRAAFAYLKQSATSNSTKG